MDKITLKESLVDAGQYIYRLNQRFGTHIVDRALAHHVRRDLRAYVLTGVTQDSDGQRTRFVDYDWSHLYDGMPEWVFADFFLPEIANTCTRLERGMDP